VCNGENGETGFTETLPSEKSEYGTWTVYQGGTALAKASISFNIPLGSSVPAHYMINVGGAPTAECPGTFEEPAAAPGNLCIYETGEAEAHFTTSFNPETQGFGQAGKSGIILWFASVGFEGGSGTWAVTAP